MVLVGALLTYNFQLLKVHLMRLGRFDYVSRKQEKMIKRELMKKSLKDGSKEQTAKNNYSRVHREFIL